MSHQPERPTIVDRVNSIDFAAPPKHNTLRNKMRQWQAMSKEAGSNRAGTGRHPKKRIPSMPKLPWSDPS